MGTSTTKLLDRLGRLSNVTPRTHRPETTMTATMTAASITAANLATYNRMKSQQTQYAAAIDAMVALSQEVAINHNKLSPETRTAAWSGLRQALAYLEYADATLACTESIAALAAEYESRGYARAKMEASR